MNSNDLILCDDIINNQNINDLKRPSRFDLSRSLTTTLTSSSTWVIEISLFSISAVFEVSSAGIKSSFYVRVCES